MIKDTIAELEARLQKAEAVNSEKKAELLRLIAMLKRELQERGEAHGQHAPAAAGEPDLTTQEAREKRRAELSLLSLDEISDLVSQFEKTHPHLVQVVNRVCQTLANLGI
jgi:uncharacterized protein YqeY